MKRTVCLSVCFLLLAVLCACAASSATDLSGFLQNRKDLGAPLDLTRLYRTGSDAGEQYWLPLGETLSLRLFSAETGALYECRVLLHRFSAEGKTLPLTETDYSAFQSECAATLRAFCGMGEEAALGLLRALSLFEGAARNDSGTLTTRSGPFLLTLQSHPLELAFSVRDTRLREEPTASVPESRPLFGETIATRRETVPHK